MDGAMQTLRHKSVLQLANRERRACVPTSAQRPAARPNPVGALGAARALVAPGYADAIESLGSAIRERLRM